MTGDGGLIALSIHDCDILLTALRGGSFSRDDLEPLVALMGRLAEWRARHVEAGVDGD